MNYQQEQQEWNDIVRQAIGQDAELLSVSVYSSDCRIYQMSDSVYKMRRITPASCRGRLNSLEDEFLILDLLESVPDIPRARRYKRQGAWEMLEMSQLPSLPLNDPTFSPPPERLSDFIRVARHTLRINRLGCSHGDLSAHNVGRNILGSLSFFDFDQARIANPLHCMLRDFLGIGIYAGPSDISLLKRARNVRVLGPLVKILGLPVRSLKELVRGIQRLRGSLVAERALLRSRVAMLEDEKLATLAQAWTLAAHSNASAPGVPVAYYSLDIAGINFPGERPWLLRWYNIQRAVDFRGKKFLELGSNLGLLSIHAKLEGASACLGLDIDHEIVQAASLAAGAFDVEVNFRQQNLDDPAPWEIDLSGYDIVSALSVMHWIQDKERVWRFLGKHREVIYEGHESDIEAEASLRKHGFTRISNLGQSERGRRMFYAAKQP